MADEDPAALYLNKDYWARMVWNEAVSSALWQMDGWDPFRGKQSGYATFVGKRQVTMLGVTFDANLAYRNDRHVNQHFTSLYTAGKNPISKAQCENAISEITTRSREPVTNDGTVAFAIAPNSFLRLVDYQYQWDIGDTRIFGGCSNFSVTQDGEVLNDDDKYTLSLKFAHVSVTSKLARKFALICNRAATHVADGTTGSLNDMGVWIDTFSSHVLDNGLHMAKWVGAAACVVTAVGISGGLFVLTHGIAAARRRRTGTGLWRRHRSRRRRVRSRWA